ncbi:MAG: MarR family transcriptional regulator [Acidobacteria bacterium]|nr:MarR family transcriptional regulator [Acidobacteriota bacterium]
MKDNPHHDDATTGPKLWIILARAYGSLAAYVEVCIAAEGICLSDFMVLEVLLHKGPTSISGIGEKVLLANASMTAAIDRLEHKGWVARHSSEHDRRSRIAALTPSGRAFISDLYARHAQDIEAVTSVLTEREKNQMRASLKKLGLAAAEATARRRS